MLIKLFVPNARKGSDNKTFKSNFKKPYYNALEKISDTDELYKIVKADRHSNTFNPDLSFVDFHELTDDEIIDLFVNYYLEKNSTFQATEEATIT